MSNTNLWEKFNKTINTEAIAEEVKESAENGNNRREVPPDTYEVEVFKLELTESKKHSPMVTAWFKIIEGDYKNCYLFMNQIIPQGFQIHIVNELLRELAPEKDIQFDDYKQYGNLLMDIMEEINGKYEYKLKYEVDSKGYGKFKIEEIYVLE